MVLSTLRTLAVVLPFAFQVEGHGYMSKPAARNVVHALGPAVPGDGAFGPGNVQNLNGGIGGGTAGQATYERDGYAVCGDIPSRPGGPAFQAPFSQPWDSVTPVQGVYVAGGPIEIEITTTAQHMGWYEFRLCESDDGGATLSNKELQDCLNKNVLQFYDLNEIKNSIPSSAMPGTATDPTDYTGYNPWVLCSGIPGAPKGSCCNDGGTCSAPESNTDRFMLPTNNYISSRGGKLTMRYRIPSNVQCRNCVLQWYWQTGNSPGHWPETFWNCADIQVIASGGMVPSPAPTSPTSGVTLSPTVTQTSCRQTVGCTDIKRYCSVYCNDNGRGGASINQCWGSGLSSFGGEFPSNVYQLCQCNNLQYYTVPGSACKRTGSNPLDTCPQGSGGECYSECCDGVTAVTTQPSRYPTPLPTNPSSPVAAPTTPVTGTCAAVGEGCNPAWCALGGRFAQYCCCSGSTCVDGIWPCRSDTGTTPQPTNYPTPATPTPEPSTSPSTSSPSTPGATTSPSGPPTTRAPTGPGENARLIAYVGNWLTCPSDVAMRKYTHVLVSFAVTYTWNPTKNSCSATCQLNTPVPACSNNAGGAAATISRWQALDTKVLLSVGGAGMGGSWSGDQNDCWSYCFSRVDSVVSQIIQIVNSDGYDGVDIDYEYFFRASGAANNKVVGNEAVQFVTDLTTKLRMQLPVGKLLTHAPMDSDLVSGDDYFNIIQSVAGDLDFLMPQYYNGVTRPGVDGLNPTTPPPGRMSALTHYSALVNDIFSGDASKVVFGFCVSECSGTGSNVDAQTAADIMTQLTAAFPNHGGAFFWQSSNDAFAQYSTPLDTILAPLRAPGIPTRSPTISAGSPTPAPVVPTGFPTPQPLPPSPEPTRDPTDIPTASNGVCAVRDGSCNPAWCSLGGQYLKYCCCDGLTCEPGIWVCAATAGPQNPQLTNRPTPRNENPSYMPTPQPTQPTAQPTPYPINGEVQPPMLSQGKNCIYIDYKLNWADMTKDIISAVDVGYNCIFLAFYLLTGPADALLQWKSVTIEKRTQALQYAHDKNAVVMLSAGGATMHMEHLVDDLSLAKTFCEAASQFAIDYDLDGVDFDFELTPGNWQPLSNNGNAIDWFAQCSIHARAKFASSGVTDKKYFISHAPQAPYLGAWACGGATVGCLFGYVEVYKRAQGAIDWLNIQYYNQGQGVYTTYDDLFVEGNHAISLKSAVQEINNNGLPYSAIVVGKPISLSDASNGHVSPEVLSGYVAKANAELGWNGGVMFWMWDPAAANSLLVMAYGERSATTISSSSSSSSGDGGDSDDGALDEGAKIAIGITVAIFVLGAILAIVYFKPSREALCCCCSCPWNSGYSRGGMGMQTPSSRTPHLNPRAHDLNVMRMASRGSDGNQQVGV
mmetsp:Transcript_10953/g.21740  ORF Transcript_10953/g.21740 Transcript_10953/m.21740 type:complete len:1383 (+) Transcript_10953:208-4356(+)